MNEKLPRLATALESLMALEALSAITMTFSSRMSENLFWFRVGLAKEESLPKSDSEDLVQNKYKKSDCIIGSGHERMCRISSKDYLLSKLLN